MKLQRRGFNFPPGFLTKSVLKVVAGGTVAFCALQYYTAGENFHKDFLMPVVHKLVDGETAHKMSIKALKLGLIPTSRWMKLTYPELETEVLGMKFENPLGLAAGFDKDGETIDALEKLGFGFVEIGSVTPLPQAGNPTPRVFRLIEDRAVINRYGFNSAGHGPVRVNVKKSWKAPTPNEKNRVFLGVNLGKNKESKDPNLEYSAGVILFHPMCDYLVVNVSSPNTPGLRSMQGRKELEKLLKTLAETRQLEKITSSPKLFLKVSPDLTYDEKKDIVSLVIDPKYRVDGLIVGNTTTSRPGYLRSPEKDEKGGLSGAPLHYLATENVKDFYKLLQGRVTIIGCGGIYSGKEAYERIRAGASLVQIYSVLVYEGFPAVGKIKRELAECLKKDGFKSVHEAVGLDAK